MLRVYLRLRADIEADSAVEPARVVARQSWLPDVAPERCAVDGKRTDESHWNVALNSEFREFVSVTWSSANFVVDVHSKLNLLMGPTSSKSPPYQLSLRELIDFLVDAPLEWGFLDDTRGYSIQRFGADRKLGALIFSRWPRAVRTSTGTYPALLL